MCSGYVTVCTSLSIYFAAITVGYNVTAVNVSESDGMAQLTVAISMLPGTVRMETSFYLLVNTMDGSATVTGMSHARTHACTHTHTHTHKHTHTCTHTHTLLPPDKPSLTYIVQKFGIFFIILPEVLGAK